MELAHGRRWAEMLRGECRVIVQTEWDGKSSGALVALHARRSAASIAAFREAHPAGRIAVMLTGTDLYGDLRSSAETETARSLDLGDRIVVLQDEALALLRPRWRAKAQVIYQSAPALPKVTKPRARLDCVAAGHLREVKDPRTLFAAMESLPAGLPIRLQHFGNALDPELGTRPARSPKGSRAIAIAARDRTRRCAAPSARHTSSYIPRSWRAAPT
jgi:hypothetical protein